MSQAEHQIDTVSCRCGHRSLHLEADAVGVLQQLRAQAASDNALPDSAVGQRLAKDAEREEQHSKKYKTKSKRANESPHADKKKKTKHGASSTCWVSRIAETI